MDLKWWFPILRLFAVSAKVNPENRLQGTRCWYVVPMHESKLTSALLRVSSYKMNELLSLFIIIFSLVIVHSYRFSTHSRLTRVRQHTVLDALSPEAEKFMQYATSGMDKFKQGNLDAAIADMDIAMSSNSSQPLQQRGMLLYIAGRYAEAAEQLMHDIDRIEHVKFYKADEIRLWCSACYHKQGLTEQALEVLDLDDKIATVKNHLANLTDYAVEYFKTLKKKLKKIN